jgi:hypothetical protein
MCLHIMGLSYKLILLVPQNRSKSASKSCVERGQRVRRLSDGQLFEVKEIVKGQLWVRWLNQVLNWSAITLPWSDVELAT